MYGHMGNQPNAMGKVLRCYSFNYNGQCLRQGSQYSQSCTRCFGQHPVKNCPRQNGRFTPYTVPHMIIKRNIFISIFFIDDFK
jgi:hypothetical protein